MLKGELEAKQMLAAAGITVNDTRLARSREEAVAISRELGFPVVLKIVSPDIVHKTDAGGVKLNLQTADKVGSAYDAILQSVKQRHPAAGIEGVSVQPMARPGVEVIIGVSQDTQFGRVLMFGLGGILVELLKDVSFRVIPLAPPDAGDMIREIKGYPLLTGYRSQEAVDLSALENMLLRVSRFIEENPAITELDLNPVIASGNGAVAVDARIVTSDEKDIAAPPVKINQQAPSLDFLFHPRSVAVVGASNNPNSRGYDYLSNLTYFEFPGRIYPIHLKESEVMGIKAYPDVKDVPGEVDYVIWCTALERLPAYIPNLRLKKVKAVHIFSARGSETGRTEGRKLEADIRKLAADSGIRLIGPNCMGIYCPEACLSFTHDFPKEKGNVGALIQSGGSSVDLVKYGAMRGLKFSKVVSYGNALDINEMDLLKYFSADPETRVIIAFVEGLKGDSREFLELVRNTSSTKPFIICKGGKSQAGARSTMSHTASIAHSSPVWDSAIRQAGGIPVRDIDDLIHMAVAFSFLPPVKGRRLGTGGSGGGRNTVSADEWEDNGYRVVPLPPEIREEFRRRGAILWDVIDNPADRSITVPGDAFTVPALLLEMARHPDFDFICANVAGEDHPFSRETFDYWITDNVNGYIKLYKTSPKPFFLIFNDRPLGIRDMEHWFWQEMGKIRTRLVEERIPFFPNVDTAARVIDELISYYRRKTE